MKIGVVGCGALGSYYGAKLWQSGHEVHFLLRSDYDVVREHGVQIESLLGNFNARPLAAKLPGEIGRCDLVLIGLKTTANGCFPSLLSPLIGRHTLLLTLQNGLGNEHTLAALFPASRIFGGLCFVCLNRLRPGYVLHTGEGNVVLGEYQNQPSVQEQFLAKMFQDAGIKCSVCENLEMARWEKLVWNVPFNGLGVAGVAGLDAVVRGQIAGALNRHDCLATDELLGDPHWESLVHGLMMEVIQGASKLGFQISEAFADKMIARTRKLGAYRASTLVDYERNQPLELDSIFLKPLALAEGVGARMPLLKNLCAVLVELDRRRADNI